MIFRCFLLFLCMFLMRPREKLFFAVTSNFDKVEIFFNILSPGGHALPNGTKVESLEQNNRFSPSILYTALACTHARALEYILSELSIRSSTHVVTMYVLMCSKICLCISLPHPHTHPTLRSLLKSWRVRYVQHNTKGRFNRAH